MALTASERTKVFLVFGIPEMDQVVSVTRLFNPLGGPYFDLGDISAVRDALDTKLTAVTTTQEIAVRDLTLEWDSTNAVCEMKAQKAYGVEGNQIIDKDVRRQNIRERLGEVLGFFCPHGGFVQEALRDAGNGAYGNIVR